MKIFVLAVLVFLSVIFQGTLLNFVTIAGIKPDFLLIWVVLFSLLEGPVSGLKFGFLVGLVEDVVTGRFFGIHTSTKMLTGFIIGTLEPKIFKENYLIPVVVLFLGTIINETLFILFGNFIGMGFSWGNSFRQVILPLSLYNCLISPFLYVPLYKFYTGKWVKND